MTRRVDQSMGLLRQLTAEALDPAYGQPVAHRRGNRFHAGALVVGVLAGLLVATGSVETSRQAPAVASERDRLIGYVRDATARNDRLADETRRLQERVDILQSQVLAAERETPAQTQGDGLRAATGDLALAGGGMTIVLDDAPEQQRGQGRIVDIDIRQATNGLWEAGAEAVAINGHRVTATTAIRGAGGAITVNYRSLTRPYRLEAIGDSRTLPARFAQTSGGSWLGYLKDNFRIRFEATPAESLLLPAVSGQQLRVAVQG